MTCLYSIAMNLPRSGAFGSMEDSCRLSYTGAQRYPPQAGGSQTESATVENMPLLDIIIPIINTFLSI